MAAGLEAMGAGSDEERSPSDADPRKGTRPGLVIPLCLAVGWGVLLGYSTVLLTTESPLRPEVGTALAAAIEPGPFENPPGLFRSARATASLTDVGAVPAPQATAHPVPADAIAGAPGIRTAALRQDGDAAAPVERAAYVGTWGPTGVACRRGAERRGFLPARITETEARAGSTVCTFRDGRRVGNGWSMAASCSSGGRRWASQVRLLVDGDRLTWSSARGDASYVRCGRRAG